LSPAACRVSSTGAPRESRAPEDTAVAGCRHSHSSRTTLVLDAVLGSATVCAVARGHCGGLLQLHGPEGGRMPANRANGSRGHSCGGRPLIGSCPGCRSGPPVRLKNLAAGASRAEATGLVCEISRYRLDGRQEGCITTQAGPWPVHRPASPSRAPCPGRHSGGRIRSASTRALSVR
jgi:hypothetical protein